MAEKEAFETEFQERYECVEAVGKTLEELRCSMYDFRERMEVLHKSIYIAESESFPCLSASFDRTLADNRVNDDSNYCQIMAHAIKQWPMHMVKSFFTEQSSRCLNILAQKYNDVIERKKKYAANLYVMCNSYKRALNHIHQNSSQLNKMIEMHNAHPGLIRWVRKELEKAKSEAGTMHTKLDRYIRHKESADSKLFRRMRELEDQMDKIEDMRSKHVKDILKETVRNYAEILNSGSQQQLRTFWWSFLKKIQSIDPKGRAVTDTRSEVTTSFNPDVSQITSADQQKTDGAYNDGKDPKVDKKYAHTNDNNISKVTEINQDSRVDSEPNADHEEADISAECTINKVDKVDKGSKFKWRWIKSVKHSKASAIERKDTSGESTVVAEKLQDTPKAIERKDTSGESTVVAEKLQDTPKAIERKDTSGESTVVAEKLQDTPKAIERKDTSGESTETAEKLEDAASKECTDNMDSKETEIKQACNVDREANADQVANIGTESEVAKVDKGSKFRGRWMKSFKDSKTSAIEQKNTSGESTETVEILQDAASKECTDNMDSKETEIKQACNVDREVNADQVANISTESEVNIVAKVEKDSKFKWDWMKFVKHSKTSATERKNASGESTTVAEKLEDALSKECTNNTDTDISKETEINNQESTGDSEANTDQDVDIKVKIYSKFKCHWMKSVKHSQASGIERKNASGESGDAEKLQNAPSKEEDINAITKTTSTTRGYASANDSIDGHGDEKSLKNTLISVAAHADTAAFDDDFVASDAADVSHLKVRARVSYEKTDKSQISLRPGMILKQKTPQNEDGMCFGYKRNKFGRKRYGWYPARFVEQIPANQ